jgi:hypothetical protein
MTTSLSNKARALVERPVIANVATVEPTEGGADAHIDSLAKKYLGVDTYPMRRPGEVRVKYRVLADNVVMQSDDDA